MSELSVKCLFGLHRRERIACATFHKRLLKIILKKWFLFCSFPVVFQHGPRRVKLASSGCPREPQEVSIRSSRYNKCPAAVPDVSQKRFLVGQDGSKTSENMKFRRHQLICWLPLRSSMKCQKKRNTSVQNIGNSGNLSLYIFSFSCFGQGEKT